MLDFRMLGPLEVADGEPVRLPQGKERALLGLLLIHANDVVPAERLIDELWGLDAPDTARNNLQVYVSRLRRSLGSPDVLVTRPPGYSLRLDPGQLDLHRFDLLADEGRQLLAAGDPDGAREKLQAALALWRGAVLADLADEAFARQAAIRLEERRLAVSEDKIEAELALGMHSALVGEIEALAAEHPGRERLRSQLMLALYRSGRQAEALEVFQDTRHELVERLGIEPSPELQELVKAILRHDPAISAPTTEADGQQSARDALRLEAAARRAHDRGDTASAAELLSRCTALLPAQDPTRLELLPELAEALWDSGDYERAQLVIEEAIAAAGTDLPEVAWHAKLVRLSLRLATDETIAFDRARRELDEALQACEEIGDERGLARVWFARTAIPWRLGRAGEAVEALSRSREFARRAGDERTQVRSAILLLGAALVGPTPVEEGIQMCQAALDAHGDRPRVVGAALRALAGFKAMQGDFSEARELIERDRPILVELGLATHAAYVSDIYAGVELLAADAAAAELEVRSGYDTLVSLGEKSALSTLAAVLAETLYLQGRLDETMHFAEASRQAAAAQDFTAQVQWRGPQAKALADLGSIEQAERLAREAVTLAQRTDWLNLHGHALCALAHVLLLAGREQEAGDAIESACRLFERKGNVVELERAGRVAAAA